MMPSKSHGNSSLLAVAIVAVTAPAAAHHGIGRFDPTRNLTVEGTLTGLDFVNPHSYVHFNTVGRMDVQVTMLDPAVYSKPIVLSMPIALQADTEILEAVCENHHENGERMAATQAAEVVQVPAATLSRYVGTYDTDDNGTKHVVDVTVEGTDLLLRYDGKGKELPFGLSPTQFSWAGAT